MLEKSKIKKILVISLSNIGDIIMTFPVIDILKRDFPAACIDMIVGPKGGGLVNKNPLFGKVLLYQKHQPPMALLKWMRELAAEHYDLAVDLRNTAIPFLIFAKHKTPLMIIRPRGAHMRQQHLSRLRSVHDFTLDPPEKAALFISRDDKETVARLLGFPILTSFVVIAPGSRAMNKRWREDGFAKLADHINGYHDVQVILVGDENDVEVSARIKNLMVSKPMDLTGKLTLPQLAHVISLAKMAVVNDSAPLHLASYLNIPVAAFFGPTDPAKYGPWGERNIVLRKNELCPACQGDNEKEHICIAAIDPDLAIKSLTPFLEKIFNGAKTS